MTLIKKSIDPLNINYMTTQTTGETFWQRNKVFITGLVTSVALAVQQIFFTSAEGINYRAMALAALVAIASYIGNAWRGKGVSIAGFIGVIGYALAQILTTGTFTWPQFVAAVLTGILALVAPPPKPSTYEHNATIVEAKEIPPIDQVKVIPDNAKLP